MADYRVVDAEQLENDLTVVADAIREKGGTSEQLEFPNGMADAVRAIEGGGGFPQKIYETDFLVEEISTSPGEQPYLTISTGLSVDYIVPKEEILFAVFTCEPLDSTLSGYIKRLTQTLWCKYGAQVGTECYCIIKDGSGDKISNNNHSQRVGLYIKSATNDLSSLNIYGRNNTKPPVAGNYHLEIYRTGFKHGGMVE